MPEGMGEQSWMSTEEKNAFAKAVLYGDIETAAETVLSGRGYDKYAHDEEVWAEGMEELTQAIMKIVVPRVWPGSV